MRLVLMGQGDHALPELQGQDQDRLAAPAASAPREIGLLTPLGGTWYGIHPALPWFLRQVFARHYDGEDGSLERRAALRAWVEAVGALGDHYHDQFDAR